MDAIELLEQQHQDTFDLFDEFDEASDDERVEILHQLIADLRIHTTIEEEIFYPAVRERMDADDDLDEDLEEHHVVEVLLDELEGMAPGDDRFEAKVEVLSELVSHHIEEEEDELFADVRDEFDEEELEELGERMQARADELQAQFEEEGTSKEELYAQARDLDVPGRAQMSKRQLADAVRATR